MKFLLSTTLLTLHAITSFSMRHSLLRTVQSIPHNRHGLRIYQRHETRCLSVPSNKDIQSEVDSIFSFGVIADIQYVDAPDAMNFQNTTMRRYKQSFDIFKEAISSWDALKEPPKCAISRRSGSTSPPRRRQPLCSPGKRS